MLTGYSRVPTVRSRALESDRLSDHSPGTRCTRPPPSPRTHTHTHTHARAHTHIHAHTHTHTTHTPTCSRTHYLPPPPLSTLTRAPLGSPPCAQSALRWALRRRRYHCIIGYSRGTLGVLPGYSRVRACMRVRVRASSARHALQWIVASSCALKCSSTAESRGVHARVAASLDWRGLRSAAAPTARAAAHAVVVRAVRDG